MATVTVNSNVWNTTEWIANTMAVIFRNQPVCSNSRYITRGMLDNPNVPIGDTYQRRRPQRSLGYAGREPVKDPNEQEVYTLSIDQQRGFNYDRRSWDKKFFELSEAVEVMAPSTAQLSSKIDESATCGNVTFAADTSSGTKAELDFVNAQAAGAPTGVPISNGANLGAWAFGEAGKVLAKEASTSVTPNTVDAFRTFARASALFDSLGIPGRKNVFLPPSVHAEAAAALREAFNPQTEMSRYFNTARITNTKPTMGIDAFMSSANMCQHTVGSLAGVGANGIQVQGLVASRTQINLKGFTANAQGVLKKGDVLGFQDSGASGDPSIKAVNFQTRQATGYPFQCVVMEDVNADASGNAGVPVYPPYGAGTASASVRTGVDSKRNQRANTLPAADDLVYVNGRLIDNAAAANAIAGRTLDTGYLYTPDCVEMLFAKYPLPKSSTLESAYQLNLPGEFSATFLSWHDPEKMEWTSRCDAVWGVAVARHECGGRFFFGAN